MALTRDNTVLASDFNDLKTAVVNEMSRRNRYSFSPAGSTFPGVTAGSTTTQATHINNLINALRTINSSTTNFNAVTAGNIMYAIAQLSTARATFSSYNYYSNSSGCASGCLGMCQGCTGTCTGGCTSCTGCSGTCSGTCSGCSGTCTGSCTGCSGSCTSCTGCSGSCSGCSGSCTGGCTSCTSCSGCSGSCTGGCKGCSGSCVDCGNWCGGCGICGGCSGQGW